jgi:hypothetical protein
MSTQARSPRPGGCVCRHHCRARAIGSKVTLAVRLGSNWGKIGEHYPRQVRNRQALRLIRASASRTYGK